LDRELALEKIKKTMFIFYLYLVSMFILTVVGNPKEEGYTALNQTQKDVKRIALIGASIGRDWNIPSLPERIKDFDYVFEYVDVSGFDKSKELKEILSRTANKPDAIFLKECAAYFPGDFELYQSLMKQWISSCLDGGVVPIPVTVVPVTRLHSFKKFGIDIVRLRNPFKTGSPFQHKEQKAILQYNDWLRIYCRDNGLTLLDFEQAVRESEKNRYLKSGLAKVDGLHLDKKAYQILDQLVIPTLSKVNWEIKR
jgi:hypothetical protein